MVEACAEIGPEGSRRESHAGRGGVELGFGHRHANSRLLDAMVVARGTPQDTAGLCVAGFYGAITAGRLSVGWVADRWSNRTLVAAGTALALLGAVAFAMPGSTLLAAAALVCLGLGFAPVYPGLMHEVPRRFAPEAVQTVIGRQSGAACLGAASLPAAVGGLAEYSLEGITGVVIAGVLLLAAAIHRLNRLT